MTSLGMAGIGVVQVSALAVGDMRVGDVVVGVEGWWQLPDPQSMDYVVRHDWRMGRRLDGGGGQSD